jgi:hypothetical protein
MEQISAPANPSHGRSRRRSSATWFRHPSHLRHEELERYGTLPHRVADATVVRWRCPAEGMVRRFPDSIFGQRCSTGGTPGYLITEFISRAGSAAGCLKHHPAVIYVSAGLARAMAPIDRHLTARKIWTHRRLSQACMEPIPWPGAHQRPSQRGSVGDCPAPIGRP